MDFVTVCRSPPGHKTAAECRKIGASGQGEIRAMKADWRQARLVAKIPPLQWGNHATTFYDRRAYFMTKAFRRLTTWGLFAAVTLTFCTSTRGDVRRRLTVRSNPEGALVYVDDRQIGTTPVSVSFVYYGTRKIQIMKDGYKTVTARETFSPPWYQVPPLDFFSENLYAGELRDQRVVDIQLEPETIPPTTELWQRAESLRAGARSGPVTLPTISAASPNVAPLPQLPTAPVQDQPLGETAPAPMFRLPPPPSAQPGVYGSPLPMLPPSQSAPLQRLPATQPLN